VASHDLQEPLRKIQAFGDRLYRKFTDHLGEQGQEYLERISTAATRMRKLIDDLLSFSRVASRAHPFEPVDLSEVVRRVLGDLEESLLQSGGSVEVGRLPTIDADPTQMQQLMQNLIGNALKFHRPGVPPVVTIQGEIVTDEGVAGERPPDSVCRLVVADNGIGFDEIYRERIFQIFQRLHGRSEYEGTGIGLAICRKIAERHGGAIGASSEPGQGATFVVTLPVHHPDS
jgi:light-regulated signal transduction histidine kinase (bacteriophytochrome)